MKTPSSTPAEKKRPAKSGGDRRQKRAAEVLLETATEPAPVNAQSVNYGTEITSFDDQRLFWKGDAYYLVTDYSSMEQEGSPAGPGQTVQELTREAVRAWFNETVIRQMIPYAFQRDFRHRNGGNTPAAALTLGEVLDEDLFRGLNQLGAEGIDVAAQVAGAVRSWLSYAEHLRTNLPNGAAEVKAAPGILDCAHYECVHARSRNQFVTADTAQFFRELVEQGKRLPWNSAIEFLNRLAELIEYHPGLADEHDALRELADAECQVGQSEAVKEQLDRTA